MTTLSQIDLHLHTTCSDGTLSPQELVEEAARRRLRVIAVTDHDSIAGLAPALAAGRRLGLTVVPGVEISCQAEGEELHLLGYALDFSSPRFLAALKRFQAARRRRNSLILERLRHLGCGLSPEEEEALAGREIVSRPQIASALVAAGHVSSTSEAFGRLLAQGRPAYVARLHPGAGEGIAALRAAGAVACLAHPAKLRGAARIRELAEAGMEGLEVYHIDHTPAETARFSRLARELGLLETGGSDSHGPGTDRPIEIGAVPVPEEVWERLRARLSRRRPARLPGARA
jgi:hypothetical protein